MTAGDGRAGGLPAFVRAWAEAVRDVGYVPLTPTEKHQVLTSLAGRLARALTAAPFDPAEGFRVGADLVGDGFADPAVLGRTVTVLTARLAEDLGDTGDDPAGRTAALVEALVAGFTTAVREHTLDGQESVRLAALAAEARAERALRDNESRFRHFATHDALTGLPNQTLLIEHLTRAVATATPRTRLGLCCLDLDGLASVNDSLGPRTGDRLLAAAADRLLAITARGGHLVARLGSDQFAILVENTTCSEDVAKIADQALTALAEPFHMDDYELPISASAGVVERSAAGTAPRELIRQAFIAMHWAKAEGRNRWQLFHSARSARNAVRYRLAARIPTGLRRGEFVLAYQPLVDLADGSLVGVEALARWRHPKRGILGASQFMGLAEDSGMAVALGRHLLDQACGLAATWQDLVPDAPYVSVNLSPRQLRQPGLVGHVAELLDRTGLAPHRLQLEITEHAAIGTDDEITSALSSLAGLGVRTAMDDFGTGYSNLACLRALPVRELKLDAAFARDTPSPAGVARDDMFLATLVSLGHTLGLTVTAEGIESTAHAERMRTAGCDTGQGWLFGRPVPGHEITAHIAG